MSLINQMLKNLEKDRKGKDKRKELLVINQQNTSAVSGSDLDELPPNPLKHARHRKWLKYSFVFILILLLFVGSFFYEHYKVLPFHTTSVDKVQEKPAKQALPKKEKAVEKVVLKKVPSARKSDQSPPHSQTVIKPLKQEKTVLGLKEKGGPALAQKTAVLKKQAKKVSVMRVRPHKVNVKPAKKVVLTPEDLIKTLKRKAEKAMNSAVPLSSLTYYEQLVLLSPRDLGARVSLAQLLLKAHQVDRALIILNTGLTLSPTRPEFLMLKARILYQKKEIGKAVTLLNTAAPSLEVYPGYYALLAFLEQSFKRYDIAIQYYQQLLQLYPAHSRWWLGLALSLQGAHKKANARSAYEQAISTGGLNPVEQNFVAQQLNTLQ